MKQRAIVLYASTHGHTRRIAARIGERFEAAGVVAGVRDVADYGAVCDLGKYDAAVVGASVHGGHHQKAMVEWIARHHARLNAMPSAFFSVSLTAADDTDEARASTRAMIGDLLDDTGWIPQATAAFAGALQFEEYHLPTRVLMRLIARRHDPQVDVHVDTDYTDWAAVDRFADDVAASLQTQTTEVPS
jgi:menaquinone-dependent protoporphyrinogen oxidase